MSAYPAHREADVVLRDGSTVHLRPVRPSDEARLREFFEGLDPRSQAFRFFCGAVDLARTARMMAAVDYKGRYGLLATRGADESPLAHGIYVDLGDGRAEVAFAVAKQLQGYGLGTILLAHLAEAASENGIETFVAEVLPGNHRMVEMFRESGFPAAVSSAVGDLRIELPTRFGTAAIERFVERERVAARAAVRAFLEPRSVALLESPDRDLLALADVELAVIDTTPAATLSQARRCASSGVEALLVLSAGFEPDGPAQEELLQICRQAGIRLLGPGSLGVYDAAADRGAGPLAASPLAVGRVGVAVQSAVVGRDVAAILRRRGFGVSSFVSLGNRADLTANDLLDFWESDPQTQVAILHIESFSDPHRFVREARRIGREMPIVVVSPGSDRSAEALFARARVTVAAGIESALDTAAELLDETSSPARPGENPPDEDRDDASPVPPSDPWPRTWI